MRVVIGLCLAALAADVSAHHSIIATYDLKNERVLRGRIARFEWANPHVYVYVDVPEPDGATQRWQLLALPPTMLQRRGWTRESLAFGEPVTIRVFPSFDPGKRTAALRMVIKLDGSELSNAPPERAPAGEFPGANRGPAPRAASLSGIWFTEPGELAVRFGILGHAQAKLTPAGTAARAAFDHNRDIPGIDCVPFAPPILMSIPSVMSLEIGEPVTMIRSELEGVERAVQMNVSTHQGAPETLLGHSIGRWEDKVLVVDTARFTPNRIGTVAGVPSGPRKHLVERFQLDPEGTSLTYTFELDDPDYLAAPMTGSMKWRYQPALRYSPVKCSVETARRYLAEVPSARAAPHPATTPVTGTALVEQACSVCHSASIGGAPRVGDKAAWEPLIAKGKNVLYQHALQGFTGSAGTCPQKGGRWDVPDAVVKQAVDHMVSRAK